MQGQIENPASYPSLHGRSVFISGGGSGIGESLVEHFWRQGAKVCFVDIAREPSEELVKRLAGEGLEAPHFIPCDLRDIEALRAAIADAGKRNGPSVGRSWAVRRFIGARKKKRMTGTA